MYIYINKLISLQFAEEQVLQQAVCIRRCLSIDILSLEPFCKRLKSCCAQTCKLDLHCFALLNILMTLLPGNHHEIQTCHKNRWGKKTLQHERSGTNKNKLVVSFGISSRSLFTFPVKLWFNSWSMNCQCQMNAFFIFFIILLTMYSCNDKKPIKSLMWVVPSWCSCFPVCLCACLFACPLMVDHRSLWETACISLSEWL